MVSTYPADGGGADGGIGAADGGADGPYGRGGNWDPGTEIEVEVEESFVTVSCKCACGAAHGVEGAKSCGATWYVKELLPE